MESKLVGYNLSVTVQLHIQGESEEQVLDWLEGIEIIYPVGLYSSDVDESWSYRTEPVYGWVDEQEE